MRNRTCTVEQLCYLFGKGKQKRVKLGKQLKNIAKHILIFAQCHLTYTHPGTQHDPRNHFAAENRLYDGSVLFCGGDNFGGPHQFRRRTLLIIDPNQTNAQKEREKKKKRKKKRKKATLSLSFIS